MFKFFNIGYISHKWEVLHRKTICFLTAFLFTCLAYGQAEKETVDIGEIYQERIVEHLFPDIDTLITNAIALFYAIPSFEPEYSIRIVEQDDQTYMEGRFLEKNLWYELLERYMKEDGKKIFVNVSLNSMPISNKFKESILDAFNNVIHCNKTIDNCDMVQFDGISYVFIILDKNERISIKETKSPKSGTIENDMTKLFTQMVNNLKSHSFEEIKYIEMLKSL